MNRRNFTASAAALVGLGLAVRTGAATVAGGDAPSATARLLYRRAFVFDANLSPDLDDTLPLSKSTIDLLRSTGVTAMRTTIGGFQDSYDSAIAEIAFYLQAMERHPDLLMQVRRAEDFALARRTNRLGVVFGFEGVGMLEGKLERIETFRQLGVRVMQLSYNQASPFGAGVLAPPDSGLTELGRAAVAKMNELGVALDLSHANAATTRDAMAASRQPVLMTHGGCAAVYAHPRNKTDAQLRALANGGGVFGIYDLPYLTPSPRQPTLTDYLDHLVHALDVCGVDHVGIGSDQSTRPFDTSAEGMAAFERTLAQRRAAGVAAPGEDRPAYTEGLNVPNRCEYIADGLLKRGHPPRVVDKVLGENFVRVLAQIWRA